jgi:23S rRNA (cytidine1920-2'-O)/16S rRNA (cytidine1409-2'-O)-methyltransferase
MAKLRLDQQLVERGLCESREGAKRLILAGEVKVGGHVVDKPASSVAAEAVIEVAKKPKYVSRAGFKLEAGLDAFGVDPAGRICMDVGASTGGFTDLMLQRGAEKVYAFDVGTNQLVWKLRKDDRVIVREKFNCRYMEASDVTEGAPSLVVSDVSFISLTKILPAVAKVIAAGGELVVLVKPQFELERDEVGKGGIVKDEALRQKALAKIVGFAEQELGWECRGTMDSPVEGAGGNREFLAWFVVSSRG